MIRASPPSVSRLILALLALVATVAPRLQAQHSRAQPDSLTPRLFITALGSREQPLASQIADSLRRRIEQLRSPRDLYVIPIAAVDDIMRGGTPAIPLELRDLAELARQLRADLGLEVGVSSSRAGVHLEPVMIRPIAGKFIHLPSITAPTVAAAVDSLTRILLRDSTLRRLSRR
jgi:hypothetical protein